MRITRPLIGTAVGAGALGAMLALGLGVAAAATTGHPASTKSHSASSQAATSQATSSTATQRTTARHTCPNGGHGAASGTGMPAGM